MEAALDNRLRQLERQFKASPTYQNLAVLEKEKQRIHGGDYREYGRDLADVDHEITIDGEVWSCYAYYVPGNHRERAELVYLVVDDDELGIEVDVMPLLSGKEIRYIEEKLWESDMDSYHDFRDGLL